MLNNKSCYSTQATGELHPSTSYVFLQKRSSGFAVEFMIHHNTARLSGKMPEEGLYISYTKERLYILYTEEGIYIY